MLQFKLPTDRIDYLQLALPATSPALVARWGTQTTPFTVATWDKLSDPPVWQLKAPRLLNLSPDGEWVSVFDKAAGDVRITRVGAQSPMAVLARDKGIDHAWVAVAPGGIAVVWKEDLHTAVRALPGGEPIARVKSGWAVDFRFSPGGRWLSEHGERVFRVFDRANNYKVFARIPTPRHTLAEVTDGLTAVVATPDKGTVSVWDLASKSATATLGVGGWVSALAISHDGQRVLTGNTDGEVTLWDTGGSRLQRYDWKIEAPIAATFARDGLRAAVGGTDGQVVIWDLDD